MLVDCSLTYLRVETLCLSNEDATPLLETHQYRGEPFCATGEVEDGVEGGVPFYPATDVDDLRHLLGEQPGLSRPGSSRPQYPQAGAVGGGPGVSGPFVLVVFAGPVVAGLGLELVSDLADRVDALKPPDRGGDSAGYGTVEGFAVAELAAGLAACTVEQQRPVKPSPAARSSADVDRF